jgi:hypothetical protein
VRPAEPDLGVDAVSPHVDEVAVRKVAFLEAVWSSLHCFVNLVTVAGDCPAVSPRNCSSAGTESPDDSPYM